MRHAAGVSVHQVVAGASNAHKPSARPPFRMAEPISNRRSSTSRPFVMICDLESESQPGSIGASRHTRLTRSRIWGGTYG